METEYELEEHKRRIDHRIKDGIDKLIANGDILETDFVTSPFGDKMIALKDDAGDEIIFNYTQVRVHSYAGRLNE